MNLVLVGFGTVARRFVELLEAERDRLRWHYGLTFRIVGIATARSGTVFAPGGIDTGRTAPDNWALDTLEAYEGTLDRSLADTPHLVSHSTTTLEDVVVVENTPLGRDDGQPGVDHVRMALEGGADVITANKGPAAFAWATLQQLAAQHDRVFLCEGAVLDGLPVFSLFRHSLPVVTVSGFRGVLNTTTNHVISAMESGMSLDDAVCEMQARGIAEADPSNDIDGWDAAAKTAALANALMGAGMTPHDVTRESLRTVTADEVRAAHRSDSRIRMIATARRVDGAVLADVRPVRLDQTAPLARLTGTAKGLEVDTDRLGQIQISKAASAVAHTAYALLADLIEVGRCGLVRRQETGGTDRGGRRQKTGGR